MDDSNYSEEGSLFSNDEFTDDEEYSDRSYGIHNEVNSIVFFYYYVSTFFWIHNYSTMPVFGNFLIVYLQKREFMKEFLENYYMFTIETWIKYCASKELVWIFGGIKFSKHTFLLSNLFYKRDQKWMSLCPLVYRMRHYSKQKE